MAQTLRKLVDEWIIVWEKLHAKNEQTESLEMYVAKKAIEWSKEKA